MKVKIKNSLDEYKTKEKKKSIMYKKKCQQTNKELLSRVEEKSKYSGSHRTSFLFTSTLYFFLSFLVGIYFLTSYFSVTAFRSVPLFVELHEISPLGVHLWYLAGSWWMLSKWPDHSGGIRIIQKWLKNMEVEILFYFHVKK